VCLFNSRTRLRCPPLALYFQIPTFLSKTYNFPPSSCRRFPPVRRPCVLNFQRLSSSRSTRLSGLFLGIFLPAFLQFIADLLPDVSYAPSSPSHLPLYHTFSPVLFVLVASVTFFLFFSAHGLVFSPVLLIFLKHFVPRYNDQRFSSVHAYYSVLSIVSESTDSSSRSSIP